MSLFYFFMECGMSEVTRESLNNLADEHVYTFRIPGSLDNISYIYIYIYIYVCVCVCVCV